jgi:hypothetical protein
LKRSASRVWSVKAVEIVWPSGERQRLEDVAADRVVEMREP